MKHLKLFLALVFSLFLAAPMAAQAQDTAAPNVLVQEVIDQVMAKVKADPKMLTESSDYIIGQLSDILMPRFDFVRMTGLAMGRNWKSATTEQKRELVQEFREMLINTYAKALSQFKDDSINVKPLRAAADAKDLVVQSEFLRKGEQPVPVDYSLRLGNDGKWRCYDVVVGGVSLVTNYRDDFNSQVKSGGVDGLIKTLKEKNESKGK
jgi:phospholipid transport system substrate-binding protein